MTRAPITKVPGLDGLEALMTGYDRLALARRMYEAFASGDRDYIEGALTEDFRFSSPVDVGLDRAGYFDRCWPGAGRRQQFDFVRIVQHRDAVIVTYEMTQTDGSTGRNTEVLTFSGDRIREAEVYFGWSVTART
jgi:hypothetical protein